MKKINMNRLVFNKEIDSHQKPPKNKQTNKKRNPTDRHLQWLVLPNIQRRFHIIPSQTFPEN